jgi:DNA polymerase-4
VGNGTTFPKNLTTREQVTAGIAMLADSVASRLRHDGLYAGGLQVTIRDPEFKDRSRQKQLTTPTHLIRDLTEQAMELVNQLWKPPTPIRALTVTAIHLMPEDSAYEQVDLFTASAAPKREKQEQLEHAMDRIRGKYGSGAIVFGATKTQKEEDPFP